MSSKSFSESRFIRSDGTVMWGLVHATVARSADGLPLYGIGQVQDITDRKTAEEALLANEQRLARTERLTRIGAWEWNLKLDRFSWSSGLDVVFGPIGEELAPSLEAFLAYVHPDDRDRLRRILDDAVGGRIASSWEDRERCLDDGADGTHGAQAREHLLVAGPAGAGLPPGPERGSHHLGLAADVSAEVAAKPPPPSVTDPG